MMIVLVFCLCLQRNEIFGRFSALPDYSTPMLDFQKFSTAYGGITKRVKQEKKKGLLVLG